MAYSSPSTLPHPINHRANEPLSLSPSQNRLVLQRNGGRPGAQKTHLSCGRLCDYEDPSSTTVTSTLTSNAPSATGGGGANRGYVLPDKNKFGSTPHFGAGGVDSTPVLPSFSCHEVKHYANPNNNPDMMTLGAQPLMQPLWGQNESFYAATDIFKVSTE